MREWQKVKLSTIITQCQNTEKIFDMENEHYITLSSYGKGAHERIIKDGKYPVPFLGYRVRNGQFIYSRIDARNGAYDIISPELDGYVVSKDFPVYDIDTEKVLPRFLLRSVLSSEFINQVKHSSFGATNRMRIKEDVFGNYTIALPPMEQQQEIVDILDAVLSIIKSRQSELSVLDDLVKARFVEMFGDPVTNPKGWNETSIGEECFYIKDGPHKSLADIGKGNGGHPFISVRNIVNHTIDFSTARYISDEDYKDAIKKCHPEKGDMLYSKGGTTGIAKLIDVDIEFANWVHVAVLKYHKDKLNGVFFENMLNSDYCYYQSQRLTKGIANRDLVLNAMAQIKMYRPPIELQNQFEVFVRQVDKSKVIGRALDFKPTYGYI